MTSNGHIDLIVEKYIRNQIGNNPYNLIHHPDCQAIEGGYDGEIQSFGLPEFWNLLMGEYKPFSDGVKGYCCNCIDENADLPDKFIDVIKTYAEYNEEEFSMSKSFEIMPYDQSQESQLFRLQSELELLHLGCGNVEVGEVLGPVNYDVAVLGRKAIGYVASCQVSDGGLCTFIPEIYVMENYRKRGVGKDLLDCVLVQSCDYGCNRIIANVHSGNAPAMRWWHNQGFSEERRIHEYCIVSAEQKPFF